MFGNAIGWRISVVMLLIAVLVAVWLHNEMQMTEPTNLSLDEKNLAMLSPPAPALVAQDQSGDAGEKYAAAAAAYADDSDACDDYARKPVGPAPAPMQMVLDAANLFEMNLFARAPGKIIDYQSDHQELDNLALVGQQMESAAILLDRARQHEEAHKFLLAVYSLGLNLLHERLDYDEYSDGLKLTDGALVTLADMQPKDSAEAQTLNDEETALVNFDQNTVRPIYDVLSSADPQKIASNAGDVFRFAARSKERMFRVEAILKLGRYRFNAARRADQLAVPRVLRKLQNDPDPAIQTAAAAAANLTVEQYRMIH
jgi:hypothetical protein